MTAATAGLVGRVAVVTGAGRGIGRAIALELAGLGAEVVLVGRTRARLDETATAIVTGGGGATVVVGDVVTDELRHHLSSVAPVVDVLVNNASAYAPFDVVQEIDDDAFATVHRVVVDGTRRMIQHVVPGMRERRWGRIISIGSLSAELGGAGQSAYTASKAALGGLTRTVALECASKGITVNLVVPGLIATERVEEAVDPAVRERIVAQIPAGRIGAPDDVAHVVAALASPRAGYVTGATIPIGGGLGLGLHS